MLMQGKNACTRFAPLGGLYSNPNDYVVQEYIHYDKPAGEWHGRSKKNYCG